MCLISELSEKISIIVFNIFYRNYELLTNKSVFMKKNLLLWLLGVLLCTSQVLAQSRTITGVVTDADDGEPLIGASVLVKGTTIGTVTGIDGDFSLDVDASQKTIVIAYVGYSPQEVQIGANSVINVKLTSGILLGETVVTAFGANKEKRTLGYSVTEVKGDELTKGGERSAMNALQGKVAGLQITSSSGSPGSSTRFLIRGASTLRGDNEPLIIVDGVPFANTSRAGNGLEGVNDNGNMINAINPDDIESISVLKGAAATSIYGTDGANGVIMITTKKGKDTGGLKKLGISYSHGTVFSKLLKVPTLQDTWGQGWGGLHLLDEQGSWGPKMDGIDRVFGNIVDNSQMLKPYAPLKNQMKDFYETGVEFQNALSFTGGNKDYNFYASYSNNYQDGVTPGKFDTYNRNTVALRAAKTTGVIKLNMSVNYARTNQSGIPGGQSSGNGSSTVYNDLIQVPVDISIADMKDFRNNQFFTLDNFYTPYGVTNPFKTIEDVRNNYSADKFFGSGTMQADITKWLNFQYRFGFDVYSDIVKNTQAIVKISEDSPIAASFSASNTGSVSEARAKTLLFNHDFFLNFNKNFNSKISLDGFLGFNINESRSDNFSASVVGLTIPGFYNISNSSTRPDVAQSINKRRKLGVYGQTTVGYNSLVFLTYSARNDWSSTLPKDNNSFFYNSISGSYVFSNHIKNNKWFNFGKLRGSYGTSGNDAPIYAIDPVYVQGAIAPPFSNLNFPLGGINAFEVANTMGNPTLKPEFTKEFEIGTDLVLLDSRLKIDFAYYDKLTTDQIIGLSLPVESGYSNITTNIGDIRNKGIELSISADVLKFKDFTWTIYGNYNKNKNVVERLADELDKFSLGGTSVVGYYAVEGQPLGVFETPVPQTVMIDGVQHVIVNSTTGIPVEDPKKQFVGNSQYKFTMGVGTGLNWKGLSMNVLFDIRRGGMMYSRTKDVINFVGSSVFHTYNDRNAFVIENSVNEVVDGEDKTYVENSTPVTMDNYYQYYGDNTQKNSLIDKSFVKLRELSLSYTLPSKAIAKTPFTNISFSLTGRNLFIWTPVENQFVDPETTSFGTGIQADYGEFTTAPSIRSVGVGLKLGF